jgi:hypothetical protein
MQELPLDDAPVLGARAGMLYYGMRLLPWSGVRRLAARGLAGYLRLSRRHAFDVARLPIARQVADTLRRDGLAQLPPVLSSGQLAEIQDFLADQELVGRSGRRFRAAEAPAAERLASYPLATVLRCPYIVDLMNRPELLQTAAAYLGCAPTISGLRIDWSAPSDAGPTHVQNFHRDYDDWRFLKLFVYLTDVDGNGGPHEYVIGSHRKSGRFRIRPYDPRQLEREYGRERMVRITGPSGSSFVADTWGVHRGHVPSSGPRLLLQIQYSLLPVLKFAYKPVPLPQAVRYDRHINRLVLAPAVAGTAGRRVVGAASVES